jgi:hypothetical protein
VRVSDAMTSININHLSCATNDPNTHAPTATVTNAGHCYLSHPANAVNDPTKATYAPACDFKNHPPATPTWCCDQSLYGLCSNGMLKTCQQTSDCGDPNYVCSFASSTIGYCAPKPCAHDSDCLVTDTNFSPSVAYVCDGITWTSTACSTVKWNGGCKPAGNSLDNGNNPSTCPQPGHN